MSIRISQIRFDFTPEKNWITVQNYSDLTPVPLYKTDDEYALSFVRHILRERSDSDQIPVVNSLLRTMNENEWGHDMFIEVTYSTKGYRAIYAGKRDGASLSDVSCYMD